MSFPAKVYRILIGSPSDVAEERRAIPEALFEWNVKHSFDKKTVFLPTKWETSVVPIMGGRPQEIINKQIVVSSDVLIAVFGLRLGSPTGEAKSGTVEEIQTFMQLRKPVLVYFSKKPVAPDEYKRNSAQLQDLWRFKDECMKNGLIGEYSSTEELKVMVINHLSLMVGQFEESDVTPPRLKSDDKSESTLSASPQTGDFTVAPVIVDYSEKAILVKGNTTIFKERFSALGGKWNGTLKGWIFSKKKAIEVRNILGMSND